MTVPDPIRLLTREDAAYPPLLHQIADAPRTLHVRGDLSCLFAPCVAVVGTRKMTPYGRAVLAELVPAMAAAGVTVISGMALGIDGEAHRLALASGGKTAAVLGCGLADGDLYPGSHRRLAHAVLAAGGALLSEYPPGTEVRNYHFPVRNRILSGLCLATVVIEAGIKSGTLITAKHALDQGREVFAVPGDIFRESAQGPNLLIAEGARPVRSPADILEPLGIASRTAATPTVVPTSPEEAAVLQALGRDPIHVDAIVRATRLTAAAVSAALLRLELRGQVRSLGGQLYRL